MGLVQALEYEVPEPNAAQRAVWRVSSSRPGAWLFAKSAHHIDRFLLRLSRGQVTLARMVAGIPVITVVTTGARTGQSRTTPLLGVPFGDDIAVIGTRFGQKGTPGWYYNIRAAPTVEVAYRNKSVTAVASEAEGAQWQAIWEQARKLYGGYEAYARRIRDRQIHIMVLSTQTGPTQRPRNDLRLSTE
ncbi:MAG: nitroreductase/quinone reductase family protein [Micromonosporaceae bacterium]